MFNKFLGASAVAIALALGTVGVKAQQQQQPVQEAKKVDKESQDFIKKAIQHNFAEVDAGKLAQEKAKSEAVKQFGAMMAKDHAEANNLAQTTAKVLDVELPESADMMHQASYLKMKLLQGDTFDRSYMNDMVQDHEKDIAEYEKAASRSDVAGAYAKEMLPKLKAHLEEAKKLDAQLNQATVGSGNTNQSK
jgi:putative membrane protein